MALLYGRGEPPANPGNSLLYPVTQMSTPSAGQALLEAEEPAGEASEVIIHYCFLAQSDQTHQAT
jgi:hypothetical protein